MQQLLELQHMKDTAVMRKILSTANSRITEVSCYMTLSMYVLCEAYTVKKQSHHRCKRIYYYNYYSKVSRSAYFYKVKCSSNGLLLQYQLQANSTTLC
jgi:TRAP-type mannitol/chloroaromatic compound transport system permease small subunit